jgi:hypothetical protein
MAAIRSHFITYQKAVLPLCYFGKVLRICTASQNRLILVHVSHAVGLAMHQSVGLPDNSNQSCFSQSLQLKALQQTTGTSTSFTRIVEQIYYSWNLLTTYHMTRRHNTPDQRPLWKPEVNNAMEHMWKEAVSIFATSPIHDLKFCS